MREQEQFSEIALESGTFESLTTKKFAQRKLFEKQDPKVIKARIPGAIESISAQVGMSVYTGDTLMILEAMKMHNRIKAPLSGKVKAIRVAPGDKIVKGQVLLELE